jgi:hypothetical protein
VAKIKQLVENKTKLDYPALCKALIEQSSPTVSLYSFQIISNIFFINPDLQSSKYPVYFIPACIRIELSVHFGISPL